MSFSYLLICMGREAESFSYLEYIPVLGETLAFAYESSVQAYSTSVYIRRWFAWPCIMITSVFLPVAGVLIIYYRGAQSHGEGMRYVEKARMAGGDSHCDETRASRRAARRARKEERRSERESIRAYFQKANERRSGSK